jgi:hypothetical protein
MLQMLLEGVPALDWRNGRFIDLGSPLVFVGHSDNIRLFVLNSSGRLHRTVVEELSFVWIGAVTRRVSAVRQKPLLLLKA